MFLGQGAQSFWQQLHRGGVGQATAEVQQVQDGSLLWPRLSEVLLFGSIFHLERFSVQGTLGEGAQGKVQICKVGSRLRTFVVISF